MSKLVKLSGRMLLEVLDARRQVLEKEIADCARCDSRIGMIQGHVDELRELVNTKQSIRATRFYALTEL